MMNITLPAWPAPAGCTLTSPMARSATAAATPGRLDPGLSRILRADAAPRWRNARVRSFTPDYVEQVLQNALAGDLLYQWELFDLMEDTWPRLAKALGEIKRQVAAMRWTVTPWAEDGEEPEDDAEANARLVSHAIWRMRPEADGDELAFGGIVYDMLDAWGKGVSLVELLWEERDTPTLGRIVTPRAGQWVHPVNYGVTESGRIGLRLAGTGGRVGATSVLSPELAELPPYKFLVGVARSKSSHFLGAALLRPLAWWWAAGNFSAEWCLNYAQLFGVPIRWATHDPTASDALIAKIGAMMTNVGSSGWAVFPQGTDLKLYEATNTAGNSPQDGIMDRADTYCDMLVLGQTLTSDTQGVGSQALGKVHERVRGDILQAAADWVAGVLNRQLVPAILELNFGHAEASPELKAEPVRASDAAANAERVVKLLGAGVPLPAEWLYEHLEIPAPEDGEKVIGGGSATGPMGAIGQAPGMAQDAPEGVGGYQDTPEGEKRAAEAPPRAKTGAAEDDETAEVAGKRAAGLGSDPANAIADRKAAVLAAAYAGAMAPFRKAILESTSPEDAEARVRALYADWQPERVSRLVEEALQISAAAGA